MSETDPLIDVLFTHGMIGTDTCGCGWVAEESDWDSYPNPITQHLIKALREKFVIVPREDLGDDSLIEEVRRHRVTPQGLCQCGFDHRSQPGEAVWDTLSAHLAREAMGYIQHLEGRN